MRVANAPAAMRSVPATSLFTGRVIPRDKTTEARESTMRAKRVPKPIVKNVRRAVAEASLARVVRTSVSSASMSVTALRIAAIAAVLRPPRTSAITASRPLLSRTSISRSSSRITPATSGSRASMRLRIDGSRRFRSAMLFANDTVERWYASRYAACPVSR